ncbi:jg6311 [Pararge aegeria aegeria]|uniref:Jg6311 protein n=1 Tax=Pararge aegeria aegeria TaxID=348720 RepID=A0A8S4QJU3_9NEOP|nr:jg6311 [Pararge aegeria aegeria]
MRFPDDLSPLNQSKLKTVFQLGSPKSVSLGYHGFTPHITYYPVFHAAVGMKGISAEEAAARRVVAAAYELFSIVSVKCAINIAAPSGLGSTALAGSLH